MAKTESTAVNELISLVQNRQQPQAEPASDLFASPSPAQKPATINPPRMTSTVPAMRGAGEVAPLPRGRAPQSTSSHQLPALPPPVRMKTASPARGTTIPPLSRASTPPPVPGRATSSQPVLRPSRPSQDPALPGRAAARSAAERPSTPPPLPTRTTEPDPLAALDSIEVAPAEANRDIDNALEAMWPEPKPTTNSSPTLASPRITRPSLPLPKPSLPTVPMPRSTSPSLPPPRVTPRATLPPAFAPVAAPFEPKPVDDNPFAAKPVAVADNPFAALPSQYPVIKRTPSVDLTADMVKAENWFDVSSKVTKVEETWVGSRAKTRKSLVELARMLVVPAIVAASVGVAIGVYISYRQPPKQTPHASTTPAIKAPSPLPAAAQQPEREVTMPAPTPSAESANAATASAGGDQPQPPTKAEDAAAQKAAEAAAAANPNDPAAEPRLTHDAPAAANPEPAPVREIQTPKEAVKLVDVRIDSKPSGATVTLVDNGKPSFLGTTPLATSLDAAHGYDVIFTLEGRPTQMAHLDPAKQPRLEVSLGHTHHHSAQATTAPAIVDAPKAAPKADAPKAAPKAEAKIVTPKAETKAAKTDAPKAEAKVDAPKAKAAAKKLAEPSFDTAGDAGGKGTLMVSSKPPCEIYVDGKATGLTTPQRSLPLAAGAHKITFVNAAENIKKTVSVKITADQSTKLIQDLMAH